MVSMIKSEMKVFLWSTDVKLGPNSCKIRS